MTDLPFKAHYTDDAGDTQCRAFATNAEAREFRARLVDGKLPKGEAGGSPAEPEAPAVQTEPDVPSSMPSPLVATLPSSTAAVLNGPKVNPSETGANG